MWCYSATDWLGEGAMGVITTVSEYQSTEVFFNKSIIDKLLLTANTKFLLGLYCLLLKHSIHPLFLARKLISQRVIFIARDMQID